MKTEQLRCFLLRDAAGEHLATGVIFPNGSIALQRNATAHISIYPDEAACLADGRTFTQGCIIGILDATLTCEDGQWKVSG